MSLSTALHTMRDKVAALNSTVAELVMIVHEDRPTDSELAVVDHLGEVVSELQAGVVEASTELAAIVDTKHLPERLPAIDNALSDCALRYWRDLRRYEARAELRRSARSRGVEWRTWQGSLEASELRCEEPLTGALATVRASWREIGELLCLYLPAPTPVASSASPPTPAGGTNPISTTTLGGPRDQLDT
jgi:hypothetical protein